MNMLMVGDIVGPDAVAYLAGRLPELCRAYGVDLVVANAENCAVTAPTPWRGFGMMVGLVERLLENGVDVVTSGNHIWDGPEAEAVHRHPRVLRPHNVPEEAVGKGVVALEIGDEPVSVVNLGSETAAMPRALPPYESWLAAEPGGHGHRGLPRGLRVGEDGVRHRGGREGGRRPRHAHPRAHDQPPPLARGTALVVDVGMTGPSGSPGGFPLEHFAARMKGEDPAPLPPFELAKGYTTLGAVWLRIEGGKTLEVERVG